MFHPPQTDKLFLVPFEKSQTMRIWLRCETPAASLQVALTFADGKREVEHYCNCRLVSGGKSGFRMPSLLVGGLVCTLGCWIWNSGAHDLFQQRPH